ncbi:MAG: hypothetical protein ABGX16_22110 [Pirellulales bacterium]
MNFEDDNGSITGTSGSPSSSQYTSYNDLLGGNCSAGDALDFSPFLNFELFDGTYDESNNATLAISGSKSTNGGVSTLNTAPAAIQFNETDQTDLTVTWAHIPNGINVIASITGRHMIPTNSRDVAVTDVKAYYTTQAKNRISTETPFDTGNVDIYWNTAMIGIRIPTRGHIPPIHVMNFLPSLS